MLTVGLLNATPAGSGGMQPLLAVASPLLLTLILLLMLLF
jgi:hypothetical protein